MLNVGTLHVKRDRVSDRNAASPGERRAQVSSVCNIVLTGRDMGTGNRVPLAGVPYHAVDNSLARLIYAGQSGDRGADRDA